MNNKTVSAPVAIPVGREFHVSPGGNDRDEGRFDCPLKTISAAAGLAQPGDIITVHAGIYRERIDPPRGGESDARRIRYGLSCEYWYEEQTINMWED
jgi:alpha-N-arabinofuranosidase